MTGTINAPTADDPRSGALDLTFLRRLETEATAGPWKATHRAGHYAVEGGAPSDRAQPIVARTAGVEAAEAHANARLIAYLRTQLPAIIADHQQQPALVKREIDPDCGCPEEEWDAYGLSLTMHLAAGSPSTAHADAGDEVHGK